MQKQFGFSSIPAIDEILEVESDISHTGTKKYTECENESIKEDLSDEGNELAFN